MKRLNKAIALLLAVIIVSSCSLYSAVPVFATTDKGQVTALDYEKSLNSGDYSLKARVLSNDEGTSVSIEETGILYQNSLQASPSSNRTEGSNVPPLSGDRATPAANINDSNNQADSDGSYGSEVKSGTRQPKELSDNNQNTTVPAGANNSTSPSEKAQDAAATPTEYKDMQPASSETPTGLPVSAPATPDAITTVVSTATSTTVSTVLPTATSTPATTPVATPTAASTATYTPAATTTAVPTATSTALPTATSTSTSTSTSTPTTTPAVTPTTTVDSTPTVMPTMAVSHSPLEVNLTSETALIYSGETANYTATVTNYSKSIITNIAVVAKNGNTVLKESGTTFSLEPGKSYIFTFSYSVTEAEITSGEPVLITCEATADGGLKDTGEIPLFPSYKADMEIKKTADRVNAVPGDIINYTVEIINTGEVDITDIVYEDKINYKTDEKTIYEKKGFSIKPKQTETIRYSYTVTERDMRTSGKIVAVSKVQGDAALNNLENEDREILGLSKDAQCTTAVYSAVGLEYREYALDVSTDWNKIGNITEKYYVQLEKESPESVTDSVYSPDTEKYSYIEVTAVYQGDSLTGWIDKKGNKYGINDDIETEYIFSLPGGNSYIVRGTDESKTIHIDAVDKSAVKIENGVTFDDRYCTCSVFADNDGNITAGREKRQVYNFGTKDVTLGAISLNGENLEISAGSISFAKDRASDTILDGQLNLTAIGDIDLLNLGNVSADGILIVGATVNLSSLKTNGEDIKVLATNKINIASGSEIDTGKSDGDAGDISMIAGETINAPNVKIHAKTGSPDTYEDGNVELKVTNTPSGTDILSYNKTEGISNIELSGEIKGGDVTVSGETEIPVLSLPWVNFDSDLIGENLGETLKNVLVTRFMKGLGSIFPLAFKYTNTETVVNMNANIDASGDVEVYAESDDGVTANSTFYGLAIAVGHSKAESTVNIGGNITAAGAVNIDTQSQSSADVNAAAQNISNKYVTANIVESATNLLSKINIVSTSTIKGKEVAVNAYGYYKNSVSSNSKASGAKAAPAVTVENAHSDVGTSVEGKIQSTEGNVSINSSLENIDYVTAGSNLGLSWLMKKTMERVKGSGIYRDGMAKVSATTSAIKKAITGKDSVPEEESSKLKLTASFAYQNVDNSINTVIGTNARIISAGDLIIDSDTIQKIANTSTAKIKKVEFDEASDVAIGGAGAVSLVKNRSKSEINGNLYSKGHLTIDSKIVYPFLFDKVLHADEEIGSDASKAKAVINKISEILNNFSKEKIIEELELAEYYQDEYQNFINQYTSIRLFNSDTGASTVATKAAVAGSVRYIEFDNEAISLINKGARINGTEMIQNGSGENVQQTFDGAVTINSKVDISNLHSVGSYKKYSPFGTESGGTSIGAGVLLKYMKNKALSIIENGASVKSSDLRLYSNNKRLDISVVINGGKSKDFGFSGSAVYNSVENETKSLISEGAILDLGQVKINADDTLNEVDFVGGVNKCSSSSVDGAAGLNEITRNVEAGIKKEDGTVTKIDDAIKVTGKMEIASNANGNIYLADIAASIKSDTEVKVSPVGTHSNAMVKPKNPGNDLSSITNKAGGSGNQKGKFGFGISGSVSYNNVEDNVKAYIDTTRSISTGDVDIDAVNNTGIYSLSGGLAMSTSSGSYAGLAGAVSYNKLTGTTESYVKDSNMSSNNLSINSKRSGRVYTAAAGGSGSSLGSSDTGIAIAGSVTVNDIDSDTKAYISGIKGIIKANTDITAENTSRIASLAGGIGVSSTAGVGASVAYNSIKNNVFANALKSGYQQTGNLTIKAKNGDHDDDMDTVDELQNDIDSPDTKANDKMDIISLGVSAGVSKTLSLAGTVSYNIIDNNINAAAEDTNFVDSNGNAVKSNGNIEVSALNESDIISLSGAVGISGKGGFSAAVGINKITGGTRAQIINSKIDTTGKLYNNSSTNSFMVGLAVGIAAVSSALSNMTSDIKVDGLGKGMKDGKGDTKDLNSDKMPNTAASPKKGSGGSSGGSFGIGISGSVSVNLIDTDVIAAIENTSAGELEMDAGALANTASNKSDAYSLSGAISAAFSSGGSGAVLAGAVSYNEIKGSSKSYIGKIKILTHKNSDTGVIQSGNLYTESAHSGKIYSLAVGGAVSTQTNGAVIAGSVTINDINGDTGAYVENVTGNIEGDTTVKSNDTSSIRTLSGGVAIGSSVGLGLSACASFLDSDTNAVITDSTLTVYGTLETSAVNGTESKEAKSTGDEDHDKYEKYNYYDIQALSLSAGIGKYAGVATCAAVSIIENETHAKITKTQINKPKTMKIHAVDYSDIGSIAGGAAGSLQGGALGASVSYNEIGGAIDAIIDGSTITIGGSLDMLADADGSIDSIAAGLAMARYASMAGYGTLNLISRDVISSVTGSEITGMPESASIKANENSDVFSIAGAAAVLGDVAIGASVAYNELENNVKAYTEESNILTKGDLNIDASTSGKTEAYSVGVAIAAAMEGEIPVGFAIDASVSLTNNKKKVESYISECLKSEGREIKSSGNINVHAWQKSAFSTLGDTLGIGLSAGLGGCVEITTLSNFIRAYIDNSDVTALSKLSVNSESDDDLTLTANSIGAGAFADVNGQVGVHTLNETTEAFITRSTINSDKNKGDADVIGKHTSKVNFENGSVSISGGATAGATVDTSSIKNTTNAYISENSNVYANNLTVNTYVKDDIKKQLAGVAVGGLTVSGVVELNNISKNSSAYIDDSGIFANGNVNVTAYNETNPDTVAGNGTKGTIVASGTSTVNKINNSTKAFITGSSVNSLKEIGVTAEGNDGVDNLGIAATIGNYALTGVVMINEIKSAVDAFIGDNSKSSTLINQYSEYQGKLPEQKLTVKAKNSADIQDTVGKVDLTTANVGATLDISKLVNRTVAQIGKNTKAYVAGDVNIESNSVKKLGSTLVSAQGGLLNINGSISLLTIGETNNENAGKEISSDLMDSLNSDISEKDILKSSEDSQAVEGKNSYAQHEAPDIEDILSFSSVEEAVTGAFIEDGTDESDSVKLICGGTLNITVNGNIESKSDVGVVAAALTPFGTSLSLTDIKDNNGAYIGKYSEVSAQNLNINSTLSETASVKSREAIFAGTTAGYNLAKLDVLPVMRAYISDNAKVSVEKNLNINTQFIPENSSEILGLSVSSTSINVSNAVSHVDPIEESFIGRNAKVSSGLKQLKGNPEITFVGQAKTEGNPELKFDKMEVSGEQLVIKKIGEGKKVVSVEKLAVDNENGSENAAVADDSTDNGNTTRDGSAADDGSTTDEQSVTSEVYAIGSITRSAGDFLADGYYLGQIITLQEGVSEESAGEDSSEDSVTDNVYGLSFEIMEVTPQTIKVALNCIGEIKDETLDNYVITGDNKITRSEGSFIDEGFGEDGISITEGEDINYYNVTQISDDGKVMYIDRSFKITKDGQNTPYQFDGKVKKDTVIQSINKDNIVRNTGTWADEGIEIGDKIVIIGTKFNDGEYLVADIEGGNKLVLDCSGRIKDETAVNIHIDKQTGEVSNDCSIQVSSRSDKKANPANKAYKSGIVVGMVSIDVSVTKAVYTEKLNSTVASDAVVFTKGRLGIGSSSNVNQNAQVEGYGANAVDISNMFADSAVSSNSKTAIGENAKIFAGALEIISEENQNNTVKAVNRSGSAVGSVYMKGGSNTDSAAEVEIGDNAFIKAVRVVINSTGTNVLDTLADAITVGGLVLGNSASETASKVKSNINIGNDTLIDAGTFEIVAKTNTDKSEVNSEKSVKSLIGGLIVETTALTDLDITSDAVINVGDNVTLTAYTNSKNSAVLYTENNVKANDKIKLTIADVISIPIIAKCNFDVTENSKINVGKNTGILSSGDVDMESVSNADAKSKVDVTAYGAVSVATIGESNINTYADNSINISPGSKVKAVGFVSMLSGLSGYNVPTVTGIEQTGNDFNYNKGTFDISADAVINNYNAIPIHTTGEGNAKLDEKNTITVDGDIYASRDVKIFANPGVTLVKGTGECNNIYSKAVGAKIRNYNGKAIINQNNVYINGIIDASTNEKVLLNFMEDGTLTSDSSKKVDYTITEENVLTNLIEEYNRIKKLLVDYVGTNPDTGKMTTVEVGLRIQLALVTSELKDMGYWDKNADMVKLSRMSNFINLSPVTSALTSVFIEGNRVDYDLNKISVSTEASIDIENKSPYTLRLKDVIIPDNNGGYIYVNGYQKKKGNSKSPVANIIIHNKYTNAGKDDIKILGDIEINGNIENKAGDVEIGSTGGIIVNGVISAGKNVDIRAGGKFVQKYVDALIHLGGEPIKLFNNKDIGTDNTIKGSSVLITAREVNVNGKIQAGTDKQQLNIDDEIISQIKSYEKSKLVTTSYEDCPLTNNSSNIKAYWNPVAKKIIVDNIDAQGGSIYIAGQILSTIKDDKGTATGEITALDGFSNINIVNKSNYEIEFNDIEIGSNYEGRITITDTAPMVYDPDSIKEPVTKVYTRENGKVKVEVQNDGKGGSTGKTDTGNAVYEPLKGLRYVWVTGQRSLLREDITYCSASFWGMDWLARDPDDIKDYEKIELDKVPLVEGEYVEYCPKVEKDSGETLNKGYLEQKTYEITVKERKLVFTDNWSETYPWYKFKKDKYYTRDVFETGYKKITRSSINADAPIKINFIGAEDFGTFNVDSKQGAVKFNRSFGNNSTNIVLDSAGINSAPSVVLSVYGITLKSASSIGDLQNPLGIDSQSGMGVNVTALNGGTYLCNDNGGLLIGNTDVPNGDMVIAANGDIKQSDPSKSIISKGIDFTSKTGEITGISLSGVDNPIKANAMGDISINVLNGDAKVDSVVSQQGTVKIAVLKGNLSADVKDPKPALLDYKDDKLIVNTNVKPLNIKGTEVILQAYNIGGTALYGIEKASLDKAILDNLASIPGSRIIPDKKVVYKSPLTKGDIKGEFISLLEKDEKTGMTQYLFDEIQKLPNPAKVENSEAFVQMLNSIIFVEYNKFYNEAITLLDPDSITGELKDLMDNSSKTVEEAQRLNRLILEALYPVEIKKSVPVEIDVTIVELPYINDLNIETGKLSVVSGHEEDVTGEDGSIGRKFVPGNVYVDSKTQIGVGRIKGGDVLLTSDKGIVKADGDSTGIINGQRVILTADGGNIGSEKDPLEVYADKVSGKSQGVVSIATKDVDNDKNTKEDINVGYIYGLDTVSINSTGAITDANSSSDFNIESRNPKLVSADGQNVKVNKLPMPVVIGVSGTPRKYSEDDRLRKLELYTSGNQVIELTPEFISDNLKYSATVPNDIEDIIVKLEKDNLAVAKISGNTNLKEGKNIITILVTAENGNSKTYTIEVTRVKTKVEDPVVVPSIKLTDITGHWAEQAILDLLGKGIISGYGDSTFRPNNKITRAEVAVLLIKAKGIVPAKNAQLDFKDKGKVPSWSTGYIYEAVKAGILTGYPDKTVRAEKEITRAEAIVMIMKAFGKSASSTQLSGFKDSKSIPAWAGGYITTAFSEGFIKGYSDNTLKPNNTITRAEVASIISKCIEAAGATDERK